MRIETIIILITGFLIANTYYEGKLIEKTKSLKIFKVDQKLMSSTKDECVFMHCLPTSYKEVDKEVVYGVKSLVFEQANNRTLGQLRVLQSLDW